MRYTILFTTLLLARFDERAVEVEYVQLLPKKWACQILIQLKPSGQGNTQATGAINERLHAMTEQHD